MVRNVETLLEAALRLSEAERGELAAKLLDSLEEDPDGDVDATWGEEIRLRIEEIESGKEVPIPWDQARKMIFGDEDNAS